MIASAVVNQSSEATIIANLQNEIENLKAQLAEQKVCWCIILDCCTLGSDSPC